MDGFTVDFLSSQQYQHYIYTLSILYKMFLRNFYTNNTLFATISYSAKDQ